MNVMVCENYTKNIANIDLRTAWKHNCFSIEDEGCARLHPSCYDSTTM